MGSIETTTKPLVIIAVTPVAGHYYPLRAIGVDLISRGYEVTFVTGSCWQDSVNETGATLQPLSGFCDFCTADLQTRWPARKILPPGPELVTHDLEEIFVKMVPGQHEALQTAIKHLRDRQPGRRIVLIDEYLFLGSVPLLLGAGLKPDAVIGIGIIPLVLNSKDCFPFGPGLPPDNSPSGRAQNQAMQAELEQTVLKPATTTFNKYLKELGASHLPHSFFDNSILLPDRFLQMCHSEMEYPRSDAPSTIRFTGGLPRPKVRAWPQRPDWWSDVVASKSTKKIVGVCQGTVAKNYDDLIIPTLEAFRDSTDTTVLVALGLSGATVDEKFDQPRNCKIMDYIPYEELLSVADVFVTNGGYGGFQQSVAQGVPLVIAGVTEDKQDVAARAAWCGVAVDLRTGRPSAEEVRNGVGEVLSNSKYKQRAQQLEGKIAQCDPFGDIVKSVDELGASKASV